jgi:hypothetical protein
MITIPIIAADGARSTVVLAAPVVTPRHTVLPFVLPANLGTKT